MKIYKIRDKKTGLYSRGGSSPSFNTRGKTWTTRGAVSNHIRLAEYTYNKMDIEIIEIELLEVPQTIYPYKEWIDGANQRRAVREAAEKMRYNERMKQYYENQLAKLNSHKG